jgi:hypothetical protein
MLTKSRLLARTPNPVFVFFTHFRGSGNSRASKGIKKLLIIRGQHVRCTQ